MAQNEKAGNGPHRSNLKPKTFLIAGGNQKRFDRFDSNQNSNDLQCGICAPTAQIPSEEAQSCANCTANGKSLAAGLFENLKQNRKVVRVQRCFACNGCFAPIKFSRFYGICRNCFAERDKPTMRERFAEQIARNVRRVLGGLP